MFARTLCGWLLLGMGAFGQTQVDLNKQVRNALPYASGGTSAINQIDARKNVGTPHVVATDFAGADIGAKVNNAFASFGAGSCGRVQVPPGAYTFSNTIYIASGCFLECSGRSSDTPPTTSCTLTYNGPPATPAIWFRNASGIGYHNGAAFTAGLKEVSIRSAAGHCPGGGLLTWNTSAVGNNKWQCAIQDAFKTITGATNATPISITAVAHGYSTGNRLAIQGVTGNSAANGQWNITVVDADHFTLDSSVGNGAYVSGGEVQKLTFSAAVPHLAGILQGGLSQDGNSLVDGAHIRIQDVDVYGNTNGDNQQGAFHYGLLSAGGEHIQVESSYFQNNDIGVGLGPNSQPFVLNQVSARINRVAGFLYTFFNNIVCISCLAEANFSTQDGISADPQRWGAGIQLGSWYPGDQTIANGVKFVGQYFESNDIDLRGTPGISTGIDIDKAGTGRSADSGSFSGSILGCGGAGIDGSKSVVGNLTTDCTFVNGMPSRSALSYLLQKLQGTGVGTGNQKQWIAPRSKPVTESAYDLNGDVSYYYYRLDGSLRMDPQSDATAGTTEVTGTAQEFRNSIWNGASADMHSWSIRASKQRIGGASDENVLAIEDNGLNNPPSRDDRVFSFRPNGIFRVGGSQYTSPEVQIGHDDGVAPPDNQTPELRFDYRSDSGTTGAHISATQRGSSDKVGKLYIDSGMIIAPVGAQPACGAGTKFMLWSTPGGAGVKDSVQVCAKDTADVYAWRTIY